MNETRRRDDEAERVWRAFHRRRRAALLIFVGGAPFTFALALVVNRFIGADAATITVFALGISWLVGGFMSQRSLMHFGCPRCGNFFGSGGGWPARQVCRFCGLRVGERFTRMSQHQ